jgi:hypothetical protein
MAASGRHARLGALAAAAGAAAVGAWAALGCGLGLEPSMCGALSALQ